MTSVAIAKTVEPGSAADLAQRFAAVRAQTELICAPLETEDYVVQPVIDVSPPRERLVVAVLTRENSSRRKRSAMRRANNRPFRAR